MGSFRPRLRFDQPFAENQKVGVASDETRIAGGYVQSLPSLKALWQKSRRVRPLNDNSGPLREDDQEEETSTRPLGVRSGKSGSYGNLQEKQNV